MFIFVLSFINMNFKVFCSVNPSTCKGFTFGPTFSKMIKSYLAEGTSTHASFKFKLNLASGTSCNSKFDVDHKQSSTDIVVYNGRFMFQFSLIAGCVVGLSLLPQTNQEVSQ